MSTPSQPINITDKTMNYPKGHKFYGPDGQGYELTVDWPAGVAPTSKMFKEFGGAEKAITGMPIPSWLLVQIQHEGRPSN